jgi:chemotaxis protein CheD
MQIVVGVSEWAVSASPEDTLVTYSLGSCVGLALYDCEAHVGGLLHAMMPVSALDPRRAETQPAMFVDTGIAMLLKGVFDLGARRRSLVATVAGGASQIDGGQTFRIGERNYTVLRRMLWKNEIFLAAEDVGGSRSRSIYLDMSGGRTLVKSGGHTHVLAVGGKE